MLGKLNSLKNLTRHSFLLALVFFLSSFQKPKCTPETFTNGDFKVTFKRCDGILADTAKFYYGNQVIEWETWTNGKHGYSEADFRKFKGSSADFGKFKRSFYDKVKILKYKKPVKGQPFVIEFVNMPLGFPSMITVPKGKVQMTGNGIKIDLTCNKGDKIEVFAVLSPNSQQQLWISEVVQ